MKYNKIQTRSQVLCICYIMQSTFCCLHLQKGFNDLYKK
ncbi:hypothetical protein Ga0466249_004108 [Sporomusaceae bacterium BoRhaA]|nr:hypothetical protein [Pelorhabdus rhamnosifermentans]